MNIEQFKYIQIWGSYLLDYGYNTYEEIMQMTYEEIKERFNEVTTGGN